MMAFQMLTGFFLLSVCYDAALLDMFSLRQYLAGTHDAAIKDLLARFGYLVAVAIPLFAGMVMRLCFVSWPWWRGVYVVFLFICGHSLFFRIIEYMGVEDALFYGQGDKLDRLGIYLAVGLVMAGLMIFGSQIASAIRKGKRAPAEEPMP